MSITSFNTAQAQTALASLSITAVGLFDMGEEVLSIASFDSEATVGKIQDRFNSSGIPPAHHADAFRLITHNAGGTNPFDEERLERITSLLGPGDPTADPDGDASQMLSSRRAVDYAEIAGNSRVLFLGEYHHSPHIRHEVASIMPWLKEAGFTHLAMELFHSASQEDLDWYARGDDEREDVIDQEMIWHNDNIEFDAPPGSRAPEPELYIPYFQIVDAAVNSGLTVTGIEWCRWDGEGGGFRAAMRKHMGEMGLTQDFLESIESKRRKNDNMMSEVYAVIHWNQGPIRNWHASRILAEILKDPSARVAVLGGMKHYGRMFDARDNFSLNRLLEERSGITGRTVYYSSSYQEQNAWSYRRSPSITELLFDAAKESDIIGQQRFMLRTGESDMMDTPDYVVHLPG